MSVITNHKKLSVSSQQAEIDKDKSSHRNRSVSTTFEERFHENILALENTYAHKMVRRPNKIGLRASIPSTYHPTGKYNSRYNYASEYSKRFDPSKHLENKQPDKKFSGEFSRKKSEVRSRNQDCLSRLSIYDPENTGEYWIRKKNLRLPPVILPPIHTIKPYTLSPREQNQTIKVRGPITDQEWSDLQECRYLRPGLRKFRDDLHAR